MLQTGMLLSVKSRSAGVISRDNAAVFRPCDQMRRNHVSQGKFRSSESVFLIIRGGCAFSASHDKLYNRYRVNRKKRPAE